MGSTKKIDFADAYKSKRNYNLFKKQSFEEIMGRKLTREEVRKFIKRDWFAGACGKKVYNEWTNGIMAKQKKEQHKAYLDKELASLKKRTRRNYRFWTSLLLAILGTYVLTLGISTVPSYPPTWLVLLEFLMGGEWFLIGNLLISSAESAYVERIYNFEKNNDMPHSVTPSWIAYGVLQKHGINTDGLYIKEK